MLISLLLWQVVSYSISTSNHNHYFLYQMFATVVSYSISTSNHNRFNVTLITLALYLIPFLHQTTTIPLCGISYNCCILFHFYIKPQQCYIYLHSRFGCILFHFYIKPQHTKIMPLCQIVVSYSISTSNHNGCDVVVAVAFVVSYSISTSNHNLWRIRRYFQAHYHLNHILIFDGML